MLKERKGTSFHGIAAFLVVLFAQIGAIVTLVVGLDVESLTLTLSAIAGQIVVIFGWIGFYLIAPNRTKVLQLFGDYRGSDNAPGLRWANPLYSKVDVSRRVRNFETNKVKVNDLLGSPVEIAAVVVWRVVDSAQAVFEVDDYVRFVHIQSEAALRNLATHYPYDQHEDGETALRSHTGIIAHELAEQIQKRLGVAGVEIIEARISHLAYAPEIASAMLQRQQASAIIAARKMIVEGAVGMVEMALDSLSTKSIVHLSDEQRAAMVSNLLVVLCGDSSAQPVVDTSSSIR